MLSFLYIVWEDKIITGTLFDLFEYYVYLSKIGINCSFDVHIIADQKNKKTLDEYINEINFVLFDKYNDDMVKYIDKITININHNVQKIFEIVPLTRNILYLKLKKNIFSTNDFFTFLKDLRQIFRLNHKYIFYDLNSMNLYMFPNQIKEKVYDQFYFNVVKTANCVYYFCNKFLADYYKIDNSKIRFVEYNYKLYFEFFRYSKLMDYNKDIILINSYLSFKNKQVPYKVTNKKILILSDRSYRDNDLVFITPPIKNLYQQYDEYWYIQTERKWDVSPRLIPESYYYGKKIKFFGDNKNDGAWYRYQQTINDFDSLILKDNDEIIDIMNRYLK